MITAQEAKELTKAANPAEALLEEISSLIEDAANEGKYELTYKLINLDMAVEIRNSLEECGYTVTLSRYLEGQQYDLLINWRLA